MSIKTVLLQAASETLEPDSSAADRALGLAGILDSRLEALAFELDVTTPKSAYRREIPAEERVRARDRNDDVGVAANPLRNAAQGQGVEAKVITDRSHIHSTPDIAADEGRADIAFYGVWVRSLEVPRLRARRSDPDCIDRAAAADVDFFTNLAMPVNTPAARKRFARSN